MVDKRFTDTEERKIQSVANLLAILRNLGHVAVQDQKRAHNLLVQMHSSIHFLMELTESQKKKSPEMVPILNEQQAELNVVLTEIEHHFKDETNFHVDDVISHLERVAGLLNASIKQAQKVSAAERQAA